VSDFGPGHEGAVPAISDNGMMKMEINLEWSGGDGELVAHVPRNRATHVEIPPAPPLFANGATRIGFWRFVR